MKIIENICLDEERALYGVKNTEVRFVRFDGPADGESALKECENVRATNCFFNLRYPFWHDTGLTITDCELTDLCRAALWYSEKIVIKNTKLHGIKALRECKEVQIDGCDVVSPEFGWKCQAVTIGHSALQSEYFLFLSENLELKEVQFKGKYSFQYVKNAVIEQCELDTKDAFWHSENVTVKNSLVKGEYLGWYSRNLTLENCTITGTQPLCYCKGLKLINCKMIDADLCFERSEVEATVTTPILSVKNPISGRISAPAYGEIIRDIEGVNAEIITTG